VRGWPFGGMDGLGLSEVGIWFQVSSKPNAGVDVLFAYTTRMKICGRKRGHCWMTRSSLGIPAGYFRVLKLRFEKRGYRLKYEGGCEILSTREIRSINASCLAFMGPTSVGMLASN